MYVKFAAFKDQGKKSLKVTDGQVTSAKKITIKAKVESLKDGDDWLSRSLIAKLPFLRLSLSMKLSLVRRVSLTYI